MTSNWLDQALTRLTCAPGFYTALQLEHIEIALKIRKLLLSCPNVLDTEPSQSLQGGVTLSYFYDQVQCGHMLEENHLYQVRTLLAKAEYDCEVELGDS